MNPLKTIHLKRRINKMKNRVPKTLPKEKEGLRTLRTSTPRAEAHQRKLPIHSNHTRSMPPREMQVSKFVLRN